jgi:threonine aldolase
VSSGTMANQIALLLHCRPGDEVITGTHAHLRLYESGAASALAGVQFVEVGEDGLFGPDDVDPAMRSSAAYWTPRTRLVEVENTHNRAGGRVWPIEKLHAVGKRARSLGLATHLDGARIWNAAVACGASEAAIAAPFDTVAACFSKGLGAPVGSVIAGSEAAIGEALRLRKMLGGAMRQVGLLCAAALHGLEHHRARLAVDHEHAQRFARALAEVPGVRVDPSRVETNIVIFELDSLSADELVARAAKGGVLLAAFGPRTVRAVTHLDIDSTAIDRAIHVVRDALTSS